MESRLEVQRALAELPGELDPPADGGRAGRPVTRLEPSRGWRALNLGELWRFRDLLYFLAWRDVKVRYKQAALGAAWAVLQPALMMAVFTIFFSHLAGVKSGGFPYAVFVLAGLLPWTFFATAVAAAGNSVVGSERLITKVYFPRLAIPFAAAGAAAVDLAVAQLLLAVLMACFQVPLAVTALLAPVVFLFIALAALGFGTLLAALNVAYRDFRYVIPFLLQLWVFATPSVYMELSPEMRSGWLGVAVAANPLTALIDAFRACLLGTEIDWAALGLSCAVVTVVFVVGCLYFRRVEDRFADII